MKIENMLYKVNENINSRDYFFCALCAMAFNEKVTLESVNKEGENTYSVQDRKLDVTYWWFAGLKDILASSLRHIISKFDYKLDIDGYCEILRDKNEFLLAVTQAKSDRDTVTNVSDLNDYYLFNAYEYNKCFDEFSYSESDEPSKLDLKIAEIKRLYNEIQYVNSNRSGIWSAVLDTYPIQRILGSKIAERRKDLGSGSSFNYILDKSVDFLKSSSTRYLDDNAYSFLSIFSNIVGKAILAKNTDKETLLDIVNSKVNDATVLDRSTGSMQSVDNFSSIDKDFDLYFSDKSEVYKSFAMPDLNKSLSNISKFNGAISDIVGNNISVNMLSLLDSEPNCNELLKKLDAYSRKLYGYNNLKVVESKIYGTEQKLGSSQMIRSMVNSLYHSFNNVNHENILYVSHLHNKINLKKDAGANIVNNANGLISADEVFSGIGVMYNRFSSTIRDIRELIVTEAGITYPRSTSIASRFHIYLYDRTACYYDRASLPLFLASNDSELYLPVPYEKDNSHNSIRWIKTIAESVKSFDELKIYSERTGKPLSDMYYFAREVQYEGNSDKNSKNIHEKTGGLLNMQNGKNEFAEITKIHSAGDLLKQYGKDNEFQLRSLILAEKLDDLDKVSLDVLIDKLSENKEETYDKLSDCKDGLRSNMVVYLNNAKIREESLISLTDIFCDRSNRLSAFLQGVSWKYGDAFVKVPLDELFSRQNTQNKIVIDTGFIRPEYLDGVFMRYNGDSCASNTPQNQPIYYMNFSNMGKLQENTPSNSSNSDLARLVNFSYLKCEDFLGVEETMFRFVLPSIIELKNGEVVKSLSLGDNRESKEFKVVIDDYVKIGAKLAWLGFYSKFNSDMKTYDIYFALSNFGKDIDLSGITDKLDFYKSLGYKASEQQALQLIRFKLKQLSLLLVKNCMYTSDLAELCKVFRDLVCGMLGITDRVISNKKNTEINKCLELIDLKGLGNCDSFYSVLNSNFNLELFNAFINEDIGRQMLSSYIEKDGYAELADKIRDNDRDSLSHAEVEIVYKSYIKLLDEVFNSTQIPLDTKLNFLANLGYNFAGLGKYLFCSNVSDVLVNYIMSNFEETKGDKDYDLYNKLNFNVSNTTDVAVTQDSGLSRFYACYYVCNLMNKVYETMCDIAHDCYQLSIVTSKGNGLDYQRLTLDRCCFYLTYRQSIIEKLFYNYKTIKQEVSGHKDSFKSDDIIRLHSTLLLPDSTNTLDDLVDSNEVIKYFIYVVNRSKNGVSEFREYIDSIFGSNVNRLRKIAYPSFGVDSGNNFVLTSSMVNKINQMAKQENRIGKFGDTALTLLKSSVKDSGLYRSLRFKDGLAVTMDNKLFTLNTFKMNLKENKQVLKEDIPYVFLLHEDGIFFQVSIDGRSIKPVDTVVSILQSYGQEYLHSTVHSSDLQVRDSQVFDSVSSKGIGIVDRNLKAEKTREVIKDFLKEMSSEIKEAVELDIIEPSNTELLKIKSSEIVEENKNELRVINNKHTELTISGKSSIATNINHSVNTFNGVVDVLTGNCVGSNIEPSLIIRDMIENPVIMSDDDANRIIDNLIRASIDMDKEFKRYEDTELSIREIESLVVEDYLDRKYNEIGNVFDVKIDTQRHVKDITNMYSSIVPNTVS